MESSSERKSPFDILLEERQAQGWGYVGTDQLKETKFDTSSGLFKEVPVRTTEEIIARQKERLTTAAREAGNTGEVEVDLVARTGEVIDGLERPDKYGMVYVFGRIKK